MCVYIHIYVLYINTIHICTYIHIYIYRPIYKRAYILLNSWTGI